MSKYSRLSMPPLPTSAMASPRDLITDAIRKLPLSFTRLAAFGDLETMKVLWPIALNSGIAGIYRAGFAGGENEEFAGCRHIGLPEDGRGDKSLASGGVITGEPLRQDRR